MLGKGRGAGTDDIKLNCSETTVSTMDNPKGHSLQTSKHLEAAGACFAASSPGAPTNLGKPIPWFPNLQDNVGVTGECSRTMTLRYIHPYKKKIRKKIHLLELETRWGMTLREPFTHTLQMCELRQLRKEECRS